MSRVGDMEAEETLMGWLSTKAPPGDRRPLRNSGERELRWGDSGIVSFCSCLAFFICSSFFLAMKARKFILGFLGLAASW